jgi:hypothetical protein
MITVVTYLHSSRDAMWELGEKLGLKDDVLRYFSYSCCEVKVELGVNLETGESKIVAVDDRPVVEKAS